MLKRTGFKRKPNKLKKKSKTKISTIQRQLWNECKRIVRATREPYCYTCGKGPLEGANYHTGHGPWPKSVLGANLKYDLRILEPQCFYCNIRCGGMGAEFYKRKVKENGQQWMDDLEKEKQGTVKAYDHYVMLLAKYKEL